MKDNNIKNTSKGSLRMDNSFGDYQEGICALCDITKRPISTVKDASIFFILFLFLLLINDLCVFGRRE